MRILRSTLLITSLIVLLHVHAIESIILDTPIGKFEGIDHLDTYGFLGIRYAQYPFDFFSIIWNFLNYFISLIFYIEHHQLVKTDGQFQKEWIIFVQDITIMQPHSVINAYKLQAHSPRKVQSVKIAYF